MHYDWSRHCGSRIEAVRHAKSTRARNRSDFGSLREASISHRWETWLRVLIASVILQCLKSSLWADRGETSERCKLDARGRRGGAAIQYGEQCILNAMTEVVVVAQGGARERYHIVEKLRCLFHDLGY